MKKRFMKIIGALFAIVGVFLLTIQPFAPITGAIIDLSTSVSIMNFIAGLLIIIIGIILYSTATVEERVSPNILLTDRFRKESKRADQRIIQRALSKIGTGLADEKHMHRYAGGGYQIRTDKGGRIHYQRSADGTIIVTDYEPSSKHR